MRLCVFQQITSLANNRAKRVVLTENEQKLSFRILERINSFSPFRQKNYLLKRKASTNAGLIQFFDFSKIYAASSNSLLTMFITEFLENSQFAGFKITVPVS